jgi:ATP-dependent exoDNAse (exonuclease V) beta subunit
MTFVHNDMCSSWEDMKSSQENGKRSYTTHDGTVYPSMTTVLSLRSAEGIAAWRKKVGEEEAERVLSKASTRGTIIHELCEDYVNNKEIDFSKIGPTYVQTFKDMQKQLDQHVGMVYGQEIALYSDYLEMAGRVDCIAEWRGKLSIVDYKTARKPKQRKWIRNYFMQAAGYAVMFEECFKVPITQLVILMAVDGEGTREFIEHRDDHIGELVSLRKEYKEKFGV